MTNPTTSVAILVGERVPGSPDPVSWAASYLGETLAGMGVDVRTDPGGGNHVTGRLEVLPRESPRGRRALEEAGLTPRDREGYTLARSPEGDRLELCGTDDVGAMYGLLELVDRLRHGADPQHILDPRRRETASAATPVRGVVRAFANEHYDKPWFRDRQFWLDYLTELATNRINRFQLALGMQYNYGHDHVADNYLCFPYPFLVEVPGFDVHVADMAESERSENLELLRFIGTEAARRGIHFQLGLWNQAPDPNVAGGASTRHRVVGLGQEEQARYCRAAVTELLRQCPHIDGVTVRTHYEGGVAEEGRLAFWQEFFSGIADVGRAVEIDLHTKGLDDSVIEAANRGRGRVVVSPKYWAEHLGLPYHQADIRPREKSSPDSGRGLMAITEHNRRATRYGYADFLRGSSGVDVMFRVWPGTQRVLLWGDPELARGYGRFSRLGGARGVELCEPLFFLGRRVEVDGPRDPYLDGRLQLDGQEWRKYRYTYRLWGRLLYDPDAAPEQWRRYLSVELGGIARELEDALATASRILPLVTVAHGVSASNNAYWPEMYLNMPIAGNAVSEHYRNDTAEPGTFEAVSPLDPALFYRIDEYTDDVLNERRNGKCTPIEVADWLEELGASSEEQLKRAEDHVLDTPSAQVERWMIDVAVLVELGRFFAAKFRTGVMYSLFQRTKDQAYLDDAVRYYEHARDAFARVADITDGVYRDLTFGYRPSEHGHWRQRLVDVEADVAALRAEQRNAHDHGAAGPAPVRWQLPGTRPSVRHTAPDRFDPAAGLHLTVQTAERFDGRVQVWHRAADQNLSYDSVELSRVDDHQWVGEIPADALESVDLLVYYLILTDVDGNAWQHPGLGPTLTDQPYYVAARS